MYLPKKICIKIAPSSSVPLVKCQPYLEEAEFRKVLSASVPNSTPSNLFILTPMTYPLCFPDTTWLALSRGEAGGAHVQEERKLWVVVS